MPKYRLWCHFTRDRKILQVSMDNSRNSRLIGKFREMDDLAQQFHIFFRSAENILSLANTWAQCKLLKSRECDNYANCWLFLLPFYSAIQNVALVMAPTAMFTSLTLHFSIFCSIFFHFIHLVDIFMINESSSIVLSSRRRRCRRRDFLRFALWVQNLINIIGMLKFEILVCFVSFTRGRNTNWSVFILNCRFVHSTQRYLCDQYE